MPTAAATTSRAAVGTGGPTAGTSRDNTGISNIATSAMVNAACRVAPDRTRRTARAAATSAATSAARSDASASASSTVPLIPLIPPRLRLAPGPAREAFELVHREHLVVDHAHEELLGRARAEAVDDTRRTAAGACADNRPAVDLIRAPLKKSVVYTQTNVCHDRGDTSRGSGLPTSCTLCA